MAADTPRTSSETTPATRDYIRALTEGPTSIPPIRLLLTPRETAKALSICEKTLWTLSKSGALPAIRIGRSVRYSLADIQTYIDNQRGSGRHE